MDKVNHIHSILLLSIYLIFSYSCSNSQQLPDKEMIEIDMALCDTIIFDSLIKEISCIKLESENVPTFDFCKRMVRYENNFYLLAGNEVFIYDNSGKFQKRITFRDILFLSTLIVEPALQQLWIISDFTTLNKYELDGTFISKTTLPFPCVDLALTDNQEYLVYDGWFNKEWDYSIALTDLSSPHKFFLQKEKKNRTQVIPQSLFASDMNSGNIYILPDRSDIIHYYNPEKEEVKPYLHLNFHGDFLTENKYPEGGFTDKEMADIINQRRFITSVYSFYWVSNRLFFKLSGKWDNFCTVYLPDLSLKHFNRMFDNLSPTTYNPFIGSDGKNLYCVLKESDLVKHYQDNECGYPAIQQLLPSLSLEGNSWVLFAIEIK
ncbi:6-bladed beta-propeller [Parabacteroides sp. OttesenSCG-928-G07]|nr:6-bladed beta-propeller [Parabacteroides sp. OttesenSCG-928-G07]